VQLWFDLFGCGHYFIVFVRQIPGLRVRSAVLGVGCWVLAVSLELIEAGCYQLPNPTLKHSRTDSQAESESRPINRTSRWDKVTGNSLK